MFKSVDEYFFFDWKVGELVLYVVFCIMFLLVEFMMKRLEIMVYCVLFLR